VRRPDLIKNRSDAWHGFRLAVFWRVWWSLHAVLPASHRLPTLECVHRLRIEEAKQMKETGDVLVQAISRKLGYEVIG
jgi:hypothetical protein